MATIPQRMRVCAADMINIMLRNLHDGLIRAVLTLDGYTDAERLRRALRLSLDAVPVAGCRLVEGRGRPYYQRLTAAELDAAAREGGPLLEVIEVANQAEADAALARFALAPFDPREGPLVHSALIRGQHDVFCFKPHHLLGDGLGTLDYLQQLAQIYAALERDPTYRPAPNVRGQRGMWQVARRLGWRGLREALRRPVMPPREGGWALPLEPGDDGPPLLVVRELPAEQLQQVRAYARAQQATVNDVLLAAWYRAIARLAPPPPNTRLSVATHMSLRRYLPGGRANAVANLSQMVHTCIGTELGATLAETVARVKAEMARIKAEPPSLGMTLALSLPAWLQRRLLARHRPTPPASARTGDGTAPRPMGSGAPLFNNIGRVDPTPLTLGAPVVNAYLTACVPGPGMRGLQVVLTTCGQHVNLAVVLRDIAGDRRLLAQLLDAFELELAATAGA